MDPRLKGEDDEREVFTLDHRIVSTGTSRRLVGVTAPEKQMRRVPWHSTFLLDYALALNFSAFCGLEPANLK